MIKRYSGGMGEVLVVIVGDHRAVDIRHIAYSFRDEGSLNGVDGSTNGRMSPSLRFALKITNYKPNQFLFRKHLWSLLCICKVSYCTRPPSPSTPRVNQILLFLAASCVPGKGTSRVS